MFSIEVRKFSVNNKISWIELLVVPVVPFYCIILALSEFVPIETSQCHILQRLAYFLQKSDDFSEENTVNTGVLQLAVLKRRVVL